MRWQASLRYGAEGMSARITFPLPEDAPITVGAGGFSPRSNFLPLLGEREAKPGLAGRRIIIIEDEPLVSMDVESILTSAGCEVVGTAGNLAVAKTLSAAAECDAALLDVNLGGLDLWILNQSRLHLRRNPTVGDVLPSAFSCCGARATHNRCAYDSE